MGTITYKLLVGSFPGISDDLTFGKDPLKFFFLTAEVGGSLFSDYFFIYIEWSGHGLTCKYLHSLCVDTANIRLWFESLGDPNLSSS